ncbi:MAG: DUF349 domain-containing protein [Mobilicoccus sp.]|nr:DUF349 domain-containing protein [Mobilicoccus sp.]
MSEQTPSPATPDTVDIDPAERDNAPATPSPAESTGAQDTPAQDEQTPSSDEAAKAPVEELAAVPAVEAEAQAAPPAPAPAAPVPAPPQDERVEAAAVPLQASPAEVAAHATPAPPAPSAPASSGTAPSSGTQFGRVAEDGTVFVRIGQEEREVGSYPGASPEEALAYFARKFDEVAALAELLHQRVTQTDLSAKEGLDGLKRLRDAVGGLRAVGDFAALHVRIEDIATAVEVRRTTESAERTAARAEAITVREAIVTEAESIAGQPENKVQWKQSSARMRELLEEWKAAQRGGPKLDRETEQALWHRLSSSRNSFDKMRRVHFAQLGAQQSEAKARKEELVEEAEKLKDSTDWGQTAGAYKRLMDQWRQAGRASRSDDDALWKRFKAAQDHFFTSKDQVVEAENVEFEANLKVKEELLEQARAILPVTNVESAKARLRPIQEKWDAAGKVPRNAIKRMEDGMRKVEAAIRDAEQAKWKRTDPEVAARAHSLATQLEAVVEGLRKDLAKAEAQGDQRKITKAREALEAREAWLAQARAGLQEFGD